MVGKSSEMDTVFLAGHSFGGFAFLHVENLDSFVIGCSNQMLSLVIKIKRRHEVGGVRFRISKRLVSKVSLELNKDLRQALSLPCKVYDFE